MKTNREFFETVIKPRLIQMTIDGTLPSDMNELHFETFGEDEPDETEILVRLGTLVSEDPEEQLAILKAYIDPEHRKNSDLSLPAELIGISTTDAATFKHTVESLCETIGLTIQPSNKPLNTKQNEHH
jgi:hypothetical protein